LSVKIIVTGGMGKLGKAVVADLDRAGHSVLVFDRTGAPNTATVRHLIGDIEDLGQLYGAMAGADAVIHLAGIPTHSIVSDEATFRINTMGAFNVHEAAWRLGIRRVVTMGSEAVLGWAPDSYEQLILPDYLPIDESHPCRTQDCYGLSKIACEEIARSYANKSHMTTVVIRAPWIVSPAEMHSLAQTSGVQPTNFRLYHYIDARDLAEACRLAAERPLRGHQVLFVGSGETIVSEPLSELYPRLVPEIGDMARTLKGIAAPVSIEKAKHALGWAPRYSWRRNPGSE
jgi:nucleoside-diphosphate-sugar epimerase